ncbi:alpha/beta hydrolase [Streptomyces sp. NPDC048507]|uniref:alpha/beta hydrolase n=1 Tax=Streptomyces sp. NPDC048507 TaxID=3365560 RepID=UPI0037240B28
MYSSPRFTAHRSLAHKRAARRRIAAGLVVALTGGMLVGCEGGAPVPARTSSFTGPRPASGSPQAADPGGQEGKGKRITWGACPAPAAGQTRNSELRCATLAVPLDYQQPRGPKIKVAVSRLAATGRGQRHGVLLLNPGGPALGGLSMPETMAPTLPASVRDQYDLIGFDPRGVDHSTPQSCKLPNPSVAAMFPYPAADGSIGKNVTLAKSYARKCADAIGKDLRHFTTANTARDMDRIREALGEQKVSYWGQSYGTYLGAVYRSLFQDRTDRMILEGNVDPTKVWDREVADSWGQGMAERFPDAARAAAAQDSTLKLGATPEQVTDTYLALAGRLDRTPAPLPGAPVPLDGALLRNVTYALLLHDETLPVAARFWRAATDVADGKPTEADAAVLKEVLAQPPAPQDIPADNQATMFMALTCGDAQWPKDVDGYATRTAADRKKWPLTAGMPANIWPCAFWDKPAEKPVALTTGPRNTLILQNRRDNATPWAGGLGMHKALGAGAAFVGVDNGGHYVYNAGSACADQATVTFLTTGRLPGQETTSCSDVKVK